MNKTFLALFGVTIGAVAAFFAWLHFSNFDINEQDHDHHHHDHEGEISLVEMDIEKAKKHGITLQQAGPERLEINLSSRGKVILHPDLVAHILPKVSGVAKEAKKNRGDSVEAGEVIAILESKEMAETKASYLAAIEREKLAKALFDREEKLYLKQITSEHDFLNANAALQDAKIQAQMARQKLLAFGIDESELANMPNQSGVGLRFYEIRSPIKGTIIARDITFGEYVEDTQLIYAVADLSKVLVEVGIYPKDFSKVKEGQTVEIKLPDDKQKTTGKILYVSPILEDETITAKAIVELDNSRGIWKPGIFVQANIKTNEISVPIAVSQKAIQIIDNEPFVFIQKENGFEKTSVQIGRNDDNYVEIIAGIEPGSQYVSANAFLLKADLGKDSLEHEH